MVGNDHMWAYGHQHVKYTGLNPYNADQFSYSPSETVNATGVSIGISVPPSFTTAYGSSSITWLPTTLVNKYQADNYWPQWQIDTNGHFTSVVTSDQVSWVFGTNTYPQVDNIRVTLQ